MEAPPLAMLLVGGVVADRMDARRLLLVLAVAACLPPLAMAVAVGRLGYWAVIAFGIVMALMQAASDPGRAAMMNRVTRIDLQRTVTIATAVTTLIALGGLWIAGRIENPGLGRVLLVPAALFAASATAASRLPVSMTPSATASGTRVARDLVAGR